ncbi:MAG: hypothetical protein H2054_00420 [Sphingomonas sp.]|nr:hypothetical protein [Sphingomonas sp.]
MTEQSGEAIPAAKQTVTTSINMSTQQANSIPNKMTYNDVFYQYPRFHEVDGSSEYIDISNQ